jgi:hypothetical protein
MEHIKFIKYGVCNVCYSLYGNNIIHCLYVYFCFLNGFIVYEDHLCVSLKFIKRTR